MQVSRALALPEEASRRFPHAVQKTRVPIAVMDEDGDSAKKAELGYSRRQFSLSKHQQAKSRQKHVMMAPTSLILLLLSHLFYLQPLFYHSRPRGRFLI